MRETLRHREAFELYYALGEKRSYLDIASKVGVSCKSVEKWGVNFGWQLRVQQRDKEIADKLTENNNKIILEDKARLRRVIKIAVANFLERLAAKEVTIDARDFVALAKLDLHLMGEPTERIETAQVASTRRVFIMSDADDEVDGDE